MELKIGKKGRDFLNKYEEVFVLPKKMEKYKKQIVPGEKNFDEIYSWLIGKFEIIKLSEDVIRQNYTIEKELFEYNCCSITEEKDFLIHAFKLIKNADNVMYFEEDEESFILWIEEKHLIFQCSSNELFRELTLEKGISELDYENNTIRLVEYITVRFNLDHR